MHRVPSYATAAAFAVVLIMAVPASAQVITDAEGDVRMALYDNELPSAHDWTAVDLRALTINEDGENFQWTVQVTALASDQGGGNCPDSGDLRSYFQYGAATYNIQQGLTVQCEPYGWLWETFGWDFNRRFIAELDVERSGSGDAVTVTVPKHLILDDGGTPPIAGRQFTDVRMRSYSMASFGGPDPEDPFNFQGRESLVVADNMPDLGTPSGTYLIQTGGMERSGPMRVWSEDPYRSSNGGDAVYVYEVSLANEASSTKTFNVSLQNVPDVWKRTAPTTITVGGGETATFQVAVETPFGHQHGGSDVFQVRAFDPESPTTWAMADLGVHYLAVPQPAGHHPAMYLYSEPLQDDAVWVTVLFGGDGLFSMNTIQEGSSGGKPLQGFYNGADGSTVAWISCLQDGLRMGLDFDMEGKGSFRANIESVRLYPGATVTGRLIHLGAGPPMQFCAPPFYGDRVVTEVATLAPVTLGDWQGAASIATEVVPVVDRMPYEAGATLVLEVWVEHTAVNGAGPSTASMVPGGELLLPLNEYYDERPAGLIGGGEEAPEVTEELVVALEQHDAGPGPDEGTATPAPLALALLGLLAAVGITARTRRP